MPRLLGVSVLYSVLVLLLGTMAPCTVRPIEETGTQGTTKRKISRHRPERCLETSHGAPEWIRTTDTGFRRAVLYPLSYWGGVACATWLIIAVGQERPEMAGVWVSFPPIPSAYCARRKLVGWSRGCHRSRGRWG